VHLRYHYDLHQKYLSDDTTNFTLVRCLVVVNDNKLYFGHTHHTRDITALHVATDYAAAAAAAADDDDDASPADFEYFSCSSSFAAAAAAAAAMYCWERSLTERSLGMRQPFYRPQQLLSIKV
jgi:hypothetical protein